ncbi:HAD-IIIC family phosphatase [Vibrio lentus]|uniref:HAD-IIIC family phosphatase n=1 Tax=Vibrio lentus TaxID=136468 RepID=UPI000C83D529|nr:HAD-IIIC family phosphatase [Vibrio lentus]PMI86554.1 hypothetical protein BCU35_14740 [Vibrio lentus]
MLKNKIKLVIWDLDETFWEGTLSEEKIKGIERNKEIVKELTRRGVVNSICSKNDYFKAKEQLIKMDMWGYFVFPKISWGPKGVQIENTIKEMSLRADNVLFIDDNRMNLEEARFFCPQISIFEPQEILPHLLTLPQLKGKDDDNTERLKQYKVLEEKLNSKEELNVSNIEFLRQSEIKIYIDYNYKENEDRILELIERTNQLNYTKIRLNDNGVLELREKVSSYLYNCGVIHCKDNYGDYGIVGFYLMKTLPNGKKTLEHFVFSCRTMNMGLECYIYQMLGKPEIDIIEDVAYPLYLYESVDWIKNIDGNIFFSSEQKNESIEESLLLLGPCHLLQLENFLPGCSSYVHYIKNDQMVKFDCPGFFLNNLEDVCSSDIFEKTDVWGKSEFIEFHEKIKHVDKIVLHIGDILHDYKVLKYGSLIFRGNKKLERSGLFEVVEHDINRKIRYLDDILSYLTSEIKDNAQIYVVDSVLNAKTSVSRIEYRLAFSIYLDQLNIERINIVRMNTLVDEVNDGSHLSRMGYYNLSKIIKGELDINNVRFDFSVLGNYSKGNIGVKFEKIKESFIKSSKILIKRII